jgi:hypothetical protein
MRPCIKVWKLRASKKGRGLTLRPSRLAISAPLLRRVQGDVGAGGKAEHEDTGNYQHDL